MDDLIAIAGTYQYQPSEHMDRDGLLIHCEAIEAGLAMDERELKTTTEQLPTAVVSLAAALLREVARRSVASHPVERIDAERLVREAEECFRCARIPQLETAIAEGLETAGHVLMAKAVEIEAAVQRDSRKK